MRLQFAAQFGAAAAAAAKVKAKEKEIIESALQTFLLLLTYIQSGTQKRQK